MANAHAHIHLEPGDKPAMDQLEGGSLALWLTGWANGPCITGRPEQLLAIHDAIARYFADADQAEAA
jgi:hypothetical protein